MHLVVCYDVVLTRRRNRLFRKLKGFLVPVQKSVFEGLMPERRYPDLVDVIVGTIDHTRDTVRVYHLCGGCRGLIDLFGTSPRADLGPDDVII